METYVRLFLRRFFKNTGLSLHNVFKFTSIMAFVDIVYDTLWSVRDRIFSVQIGMVLLIASEMFSRVIDSSLVSI